MAGPPLEVSTEPADSGRGAGRRDAL